MKQFQTIGKTVEGNEGQKCNYPTRLDTFGCGCQHDCSYCYAKSLLDFRKNWNPENPSVADVKKIRNEVKKLDRATPVRLGGMTDCFQPAEKIHRVTYKTIKLLNKARQPYLIVTKSHIVADDEYIEILDRDLAHIEFLRVNSWIKKWFDIDYSPYTLKQGGYYHLPLKKKKELIQNITGFREYTVCEDEDAAYSYWKYNFNNNPDDCCNLRR